MKSKHAIVFVLGATKIEWNKGKIKEGMVIEKIMP